eukprot:2608250-Rhodomonas_salina.1
MATGRPIVRNRVNTKTPCPSVNDSSHKCCVIDCTTTLRSPLLSKCSQRLKQAVLTTYTSSTKLTSSQVKTDSITFDTTADRHVVNSNKHITNEVRSHNTVVGVNKSAPMTGLTEGDWSFTVKDENGSNQRASTAMRISR